ncbi:site-specific DNA-methyltransferase [Pseudomonas sp. RIT-PI-AD]|uniref:DNA-methyltransferase n=1 Tax=Pseudomonas sp. RIT-PI-AD TaxID=3035294 RepID=UPI0021DA048C|nr:site-specific DNA-methyltransferase [Pseudomonas sp. RIT-PI-AD]
MPDHQILVGDCITSMRTLPAASVHTCITSPPYYGLRDYGVEGQIGLEETPAEFIARLVDVFREVRRVLRDDGTLWVNMGDSYTSGNRGYRALDKKIPAREMNARPSPPEGLKAKDLIGIPWRLAFALQYDGWYLRQDIIWQKPNPMPESTRDRCTKAHEYVFLLSKQPKYFFDQDAIREPATSGRTPTGVGFGHGYDVKPKPRVAKPTGWADQGPRDAVSWATEQRQGRGSKRNSFSRESKYSAGEHGQKAQHRPGRQDVEYSHTRNKRSVWTVATHPFKQAHFATFPPDLIRPCVLAGSPRGGLVLDPFGGAGTTALVAMQEGRRSVLCELNPEYAALARARLDRAWLDGATQLDLLHDTLATASA